MQQLLQKFALYVTLSVSLTGKHSKFIIVIDSTSYFLCVNICHHYTLISLSITMIMARGLFNLRFIVTQSQART